MEIIIGTYEEFLVGFKLSTNENDENKKENGFSLKRSFTNHAHNGSIRSLACSNKYLASGSVDEIIHLINIKNRIETGTLVSHTGTITSLEFLRSAYLFSSSEDGNVCIWNTKRWQCEKILRGHKEPITSINLHSSGKLLLSTSKDKTLRTWNLIKGRCAYIVNLKEISHQVLWSPTCVLFALVFENHIDVYDISTGAIKYSVQRKDFDFQKRINKILFLDDDHIIISGDCPELVVFNLSKSKVIQRINAHNNRVKDLSLINLDSIKNEEFDLNQFDSATTRWLCTVSSDGFIKIWSLDLNDLEKPLILITEVDTTCRPTCMTIWTANEKYEKFQDFTVPELKISKDELEACKLKLKTRKSKSVIDPQQTNNKKKKIKLDLINENVEKVQQQESIDEEKTVENNGNDDDNDDDDDDDFEAIQAMKKSSKRIKMMEKMNKNKNKQKNKRNLTTHKMRINQRKNSKDKTRNTNWKQQQR